MMPHHFIGQHRVLEAPKGYDHKAQGECIGLPVRFDAGTVISVWKPSEEDLARLNAGGGIVLGVLGGQPPVWLETCEASVLLVAA